MPQKAASVSEGAMLIANSLAAKSTAHSALARKIASISSELKFSGKDFSFACPQEILLFSEQVYDAIINSGIPDSEKSEILNGDFLEFYTRCLGEMASCKPR
ncbi:Uncharacterised protein [uncultured archaeon]|nr:Uncharacterised protein [uncultured archaeon]